MRTPWLFIGGWAVALAAMATGWFDWSLPPPKGNGYWFWVVLALAVAITVMHFAFEDRLQRWLDRRFRK